MVLPSRMACDGLRWLAWLVMGDEEVTVFLEAVCQGGWRLFLVERVFERKASMAWPFFLLLLFFSRAPAESVGCGADC